MLVKDFAELLTVLVQLVREKSSSYRVLVAIAGPPAAGKSTLLDSLVRGLGEQISDDLVIGLPMDGFHLDNQQLDSAGIRHVKGAPATFDVGGLRSLIERLRAGESPVYAPEFDRTSDLSRNCAIKVSDSHKIVLLEGNYLLLNQAPWDALYGSFDITVRIDVPVDTLQTRLVNRWLQHGLNAKDALLRAEDNDLPNAATVVQHSRAADITFQPET